MIIMMVIAGLIGFIIGIKVGEMQHDEEIQTFVDLMRLDGVIRW
jgi:hypothetical protein